jgi:outer membrane protein assembly factor BamD (BamD/ComL family)
MSVLKSFALGVFLSIFSFFATASKIDKGFKAMNKKNFAEAENQFRKSIKKMPAAAYYGLAELYFSPAHNNLDSTYKFILLAESHWPTSKPKWRKKWLKWQIDSLQIDALKHKTSDAFFDKFKIQSREEDFIRFLTEHPWSKNLSGALYWRDSLAFQSAKTEGNSISFKTFIDKYPESVFIERAQFEFIELQYLEYARRGRVSDYEAFLRCCPENPHIIDAENRIFELTTKQKSIEEFYHFVKTYPNNRNTAEAWRTIYKLYVKDYSIQKIASFREKYSDYPFINELDEDLALFNAVYYPFLKGNQYGYMDGNGKTVIPPQFEQTNAFQDGIAVVSKKGKWGVITKKNATLIDFQYDEMSEFIDGRSVVSHGDTIGVIDRSGREVISMKFADIILLGNGWMALQGFNEDGYLLCDIYGTPKSDKRFFEINSFTKNRYIVQVESGFGIINDQAEFVIDPIYESLRTISDSIIEFGAEGKKGLMNVHGIRLTDPIYDDFSKMDITGKQILARQGSNLIYLNEKGQRFFNFATEYFPGAFENAFFHAGMAIFRKKGKFGVMDFTGKEILKPNFEKLGGIAAFIPALKDSKWTLLDYKGKALIPSEFDAIETLPGIGFLMERNGLLGLVDFNLRQIIPNDYSVIKRFEDTFFLVSSGNKYGLYSIKGDLVLPVEYNAIQKFDGECLILFGDSETSYYYLRSKLYLKHE